MKKQLAYGMSITLPAPWKVPGSMGPKVTKAGLYPSQSSSKRILILKALGTLPAPWKVPGSMSQKVTKAGLYPSQSSSKRILILKALGTLPAP